MNNDPSDPLNEPVPGMFGGVSGARRFGQNAPYRTGWRKVAARIWAWAILIGFAATFVSIFIRMG